MPQLEEPTTKNTQLCTGGLWGEKGKNKKEELILRESVKKNISHYRGNPCMYKIDRILLESYLLNLFVPAKKMIDIARFIVKRIKK